MYTSCSTLLPVFSGASRACSQEADGIKPQNLYRSNQRKGGGVLRRLSCEILLLGAVFSVLPWRLAAVLFEYSCKVTLGGKSEIIRYQCKRFIAVTKKSLGLLDFFAEDEIGQCHSCFLLEFGCKMRAADEQAFCQIVYVERP